MNSLIYVIISAIVGCFSLFQLFTGGGTPWAFALGTSIVLAIQTSEVTNAVHRAMKMATDAAQSGLHTSFLFATLSREILSAGLKPEDLRIEVSLGRQRHNATIDKLSGQLDVTPLTQAGRDVLDRVAAIHHRENSHNIYGRNPNGVQPFKPL